MVLPRVRHAAKTANYDRERDDFYPSPAGVIDVLLRHVRYPPGAVLEPAAGDGALAEQLKDAGRTARTHRESLSRQDLWSIIDGRAR